MSSSAIFFSSNNTLQGILALISIRPSFMSGVLEMTPWVVLYML
jgi:hypothetical protein